MNGMTKKPYAIVFLYLYKALRFYLLLEHCGLKFVRNHIRDKLNTGWIFTAFFHFWHYYTMIVYNKKVGLSRKITAEKK